MVRRRPDGDPHPARCPVTWLMELPQRQSRVVAHYWRVVIERRGGTWRVDAVPAVYGYRHGRDEAVTLGPFETERGARLVATAVAQDLARVAHRLQGRRPAKPGFTNASLRPSLQRRAQTHSQAQAAVWAARQDVFKAATPEAAEAASVSLQVRRAALDAHPEEQAQRSRAQASRDTSFYFRTL